MQQSRMTKREWRARLKARRESLHTLLPNPNLSEAIEALGELEQWQNASVVASYRPLGSELDPEAFNLLATRNSKRLAFPRQQDKNTLTFHLWDGVSDFEQGPFGVWEPARSWPTVAITDIDAFLIPLLGVDEQGNRLGYGAGFYDRALAHSAGFRCGVGFAEQRVTALPSDEHDARLDGFASDNGLELFERAADASP